MMQKYRVNEEVPWNDILDIIRWSQEVHMMQLRRVVNMGRLTKNDGSLRNLRISCGCSKSLRRFLRRPETKMDQRAAELLESLDPAVTGSSSETL